MHHAQPARGGRAAGQLQSACAGVLVARRRARKRRREWGWRKNRPGRRERKCLVGVYCAVFYQHPRSGPRTRRRRASRPCRRAPAGNWLIAVLTYQPAQGGRAAPKWLVCTTQAAHQRALHTNPPHTHTPQQAVAWHHQAAKRVESPLTCTPLHPACSTVHNLAHQAVVCSVHS